MHAGILPLLPLVCCLGTLEETRGLGAQEGGAEVPFSFLETALPRKIGWSQSPAAQSLGLPL